MGEPVPASSLSSRICKRRGLRLASPASFEVGWGVRSDPIQDIIKFFCFLFSHLNQFFERRVFGFLINIVFRYFLGISSNKLCFATHDTFLYFKGLDFTE